MQMRPSANKKGRVDARPLDYICITNSILLLKQRQLLLQQELQ